MTKEFEIVEIEVEEGSDLGSKIKDPPLPKVVSYEDFFIIQCCVNGQHQ